MNDSFLVRAIGFPATLIHGDTLVWDRWRWLRRRLPPTKEGLKLIDIGCGTGAFTIGSASLGYNALGLSWDERNQNTGRLRAGLCGQSERAEFEIFDVRQLGERKDWVDTFDYAICLETIEHIMEDRVLMKSIFDCLKPGGRLLLTTPNYYFKAISDYDNGPFDKGQTGWHVRRGYSKTMLKELSDDAGFLVEDISSCSGFFSQKVTWLMRGLNHIHPLLSWAVVFPLRILPPIFDPIISRLTKWPDYSICLEVEKPRF